MEGYLIVEGVCRVGEPMEDFKRVFGCIRDHRAAPEADLQRIIVLIVVGDAQVDEVSRRVSIMFRTDCGEGAQVNVLLKVMCEQQYAQSF